MQQRSGGAGKGTQLSMEELKDHTRHKTMTQGEILQLMLLQLAGNRLHRITMLCKVRQHPCAPGATLMSHDNWHSRCQHNRSSVLHITNTKQKGTATMNGLQASLMNSILIHVTTMPTKGEPIRGATTNTHRKNMDVLAVQP